MPPRTKLISRVWTSCFQIRWCSGSTFGSRASNDDYRGHAKRELKKHIHRLYQRIHPDRLARFPRQRLVNESSFKHLQSALDRHFKSAGVNEAVRPTSAVRELTFFASREEGGGSGLRKAVVKFQETRLACALRDLFAALELEAPPAGALAAVAGGDRTSARLRELVERARRRTTQRRVDANNTGPNEADVLQQAVRRAHGVRVELGGGLPARAEVMALRRVAQALGRAAAASGDVAARPAVLVIDGGAAVTLDDAGWTPRLTLGACASDAAWRAVLHGPQMRAACEAARARLARLREGETRAARALRVRLLLCEVAADIASIQRDTALLQAYARVVAALSEMAPTTKVENEWDRGPKANMSKLAVMITRGDTVHADVSGGVLHIGVDIGPDGILRAVQRAHPVAEAHEHVARKRTAHDKLLVDVRRALRAARLRRAHGVPDAQWTAALRRLHAHAGVLRDIVSGASLAIGVQTRLLDGGEIEIAHDFHLRDLV